LNAALTSWPRVEFVRMERRWRGLADVDWWTGMLVVVVVVVGLVLGGGGMLNVVAVAVSEV